MDENQSLDGIEADRAKLTDARSIASKTVDRGRDFQPAGFIPLHMEVRTVVPTDCAAFQVNRKPQTLRMWASSGKGPIRPIRINGRLAWRVADLVGMLAVQGWSQQCNRSAAGRAPRVNKGQV